MTQLRSAYLLKKLLCASVCAASLTNAHAQDVSVTAGPSQTQLEDAHLWQYEFENAGYPLATSSVQKDGSIVVSIGKIKAVEITGTRNPKIKKKINQMLADLVQTTVTMDALEDHLNLINDLNGLRAVFALNRIDESDEYVLTVEVNDWKQSGSLAVDNIPLEAPGARSSIHQEWNSLLVGGDVLRLEGAYVTAQQSIFSFDASYQFFTDHQGRYIEAGLRRSAVASDFWSFNRDATQAQTNAAYFVYGVPLTRSSNEARVAYGKVTQYQSSEVAGSASYVSGVLSYFHRYDADSGFSYSGGLSVGSGHGGLSASNAQSFNLFRFGVGVIVPASVISNSAELRVETYGQSAGKDAPNSELIYLGGSNHLRGFAAGHYFGNRGLNVTLEVADVYQVNSRQVQAIKPFVFLDWGRIENNPGVQLASTRPAKADLASVGIGFDLSMRDSWSVRTWLGQPIKDSLLPTGGGAFYTQINKAW